MFEDIYPLTPMQQGMLFHSGVSPESRVYIEQLRCRIRGQFDPVLFRECWELAVKRHPILRTIFTQEAESWLQVVLQQSELGWSEYDWTDLSFEETRERWDRLVEDDLNAPFDLEEAPPIRWHCARTKDSTYFILTYHHVLLDGWSFQIILDEVFSTYRARAAGETYHPPHPVPFRQYLQWYQTRDHGAALDYWRTLLHDFITPNRFPKPRAADPEDRRESNYEFAVPDDIHEAVSRFAKSQHLTLNTVLQGCWAVLLSRYCAANDIVFGVTTSGRPPELPGMETMVGLFINTVPLRIETPADRELDEFLQTIQQQQSKSRQFEFSSMGDIQAASDIPSGQPLFESLVAFENFPVSQTVQRGLDNVEIDELHLFEKTNYPVALLATTGNGLQLKFYYHRSSFDPTTIERMMQHLVRLLASTKDRSNQPIRKLTMISETEREQALFAWNDTETAYPESGDHLHTGACRTARSVPDRVAVIGSNQFWTYGALDNRARKLASTLQAQGVQPNQLVAVVSEKGWEQVVATLAVLYAGGAYLPIDAAWPVERRNYLLDYGQADIVLTTPAIRKRITWPDNVTVIEIRGEEFVNERAELPEPTQNLDDLAYVIFTSGSTGRPKGVMIDHIGPVNTNADINNRFGITNRDRVLAISSLSFDLSVYDIFGVMAVGAAMVLPPADGIQNPSAWIDDMERHQVSVWNTVPALMALLMDTVEHRRRKPACDIHAVILSGDWLPLSLPDRIRQAFPNARVNSFGGATEASIWSITFPIAEVLPEWPSVPYGKAMDNQAFYVLNHALEPCPVDVPGDLYIGGIGLAKGYWRDKEKTDGSFIQHPELGIRLYRTGDLGRYYPDGNIEFLGRADFQVKINGYRIELGEIEQALIRHDGIKDAVALVHRGQNGSLQLAAYFLSHVPAPDTADVRELLSRFLPEYMIPHYLVPMDQFPLTANGKVNRGALPDPEQPREAKDTAQAPANPTEEMLTGIWAGILDRQNIGTDEDFFELGGHSLLATQVVARVRDVFNINLSLQSFFKTPTIAAFAETVDQQRRQNRGLDLPPITHVDHNGMAPLSFAQTRLWFLSQFEGADSSYNIPAAIYLDGPFDVALAENLFEAIINRHESLRTNIRVVADEAMQVIAPPKEYKVQLVQAPDLPLEEQRKWAQGLCVEVSQHAFNLGEESLIRVWLVRLNDREHLLQVVTHHIISDGWTTGILVGEFANGYRQAVIGEPITWEPLELQYADYVDWQRTNFTPKVLDQQIDYWRKQLAAAPPLLELPGDFPRPARFEFRGTSLGFTIPSEKVERLKTLSKQQGNTLFMTLLAVYQVLLHRYAGQDNIVTGTTTANRPQRELEKLAGFFVNMLTIRSKTEPDERFSDFVEKVRHTTLDAYTHQDVPFERLVEALQPRRSLSYTPLFQAVFNYQNMPLGELDLPGVHLRPMELGNVTAKFDLTMTLAEFETGIRGELEYYSSLFKRETAQRMIGHYLQLIDSVLDNPDNTLAGLPMVTPAERRDILVNWNDTAQNFPPVRLLHDLFRSQAKQTPDSVAIIQGSKMLTYGAMDRAALKLANTLKECGVRPDHLTAVVLPKSAEQSIAVMAVNYAGAAYLPIHVDWPAMRRADLLERGEVNCVIASEDLVNSEAAEDGRRWLTVPKPPVETLPEPALDHCAASDLAYVIFTSGSTGQPKGVMIEHRAALNTLIDINTRFEVGPRDKVLGLSAITFDLSVYDIYGVLGTGASMVLPEDHEAKDPVAWARLVNRHGISFWNTVPISMQMLIEVIEQRPELKPSHPRGVIRVVMMSGDWIPVQLPDRIRDIFPAADVHSFGGATEGSIWSINYPIGKVDPSWSSIPYGKAIANQHFFVLNQAMEPSPIGVEGDLYIGGIGVARGYWRDAARTEASYLYHPEIGERLYRTGDLGRYRPDGNIEFMGRADFQVKVNGYRVELGEIEALLNRHATVSDARVIVRGPRDGERTLAAFVLPSEQAKPSPAELRNYTRENLPEYMVPHTVTCLDGFPLSSNGKVDRKALAELGEHETTPVTGQPPRAGLETELADVWSDLLGKSINARDANFFEAGGHSLLATRAVSMIHARLDLDIPLQSFFEHPTIAGLASFLNDSSKPAANALQIAPADVELPLSFAQQRLWFLQQLMPESGAYNVPAAADVNGPLAAEALSQAFQALQWRHDMLRTRFPDTQGTPHQMIDEHPAVPLALIDLSELDHGARDRHLETLTDQAANAPFDLQAAPPFRMLLIRTDSRLHRLLFTFHHIVADAVSTSLAMAELIEGYDLALENGPMQPEPIRPRYADYAWTERRRLETGGLAQGQAFWQERLKNLPALHTIPTDYPRPARQSMAGNRFTFQLSSDLSNNLRRFAAERKTTIFSVLLTAFNVLLHRTSHAEDLAVGTSVSNRDRGGYARMLGLLLNQIVLRSQINAKQPFVQAVDETGAAFREAYAHADVPFERVVDLLRPERTQGHHPLFQIMFDLVSSPASVPTPIGTRLEPVDHTFDIARFDLTLSIVEQGEQLEGVVEYAKALWEKESIVAMANQYCALLSSGLNEPDSELGSLAWLQEADKQKLLHDWAQGSEPKIRDWNILPDRLATHATARPSQVAAQFRGEILTYEAWFKRANQVAHALLETGVAPGDRIAVCLPRSIELLTILAGIWQAGASYLAIDTNQPSDRTLFMIQDSGAGLLITNEENLDRLPAFDLQFMPVWLIEEEQSNLNNRPETSPGLSLTSTLPAYMIYTSGTTGQPKGVVIYHDGLTNYLTWAVETYGLDETSRVPLHGPLGFDATITSLWGPAAAGGTVDILPETGEWELLTTYLTTRPACAMIKVTPSHLDLFASKGIPSERAAAANVLVTGGEALRPNTAAEWLAGNSAPRIVNEYGPTETVVGCIAAELSTGNNADWLRRSNVPIGQPISGTTARILDHRGNPVPVNVSGRLMLGGTNIGLGYWNRPSLTASRFLPDAYATEPGARCYESGDWARFRRDGQIEYLGRQDQQIKLRGYRIELEEIEAVLSAQPGIESAAVWISEHAGAALSRLSALIVTRPGNDLDETVIKEQLSQQLPSYMIPGTFHPVEAIPLTANGKIDRQALPCMAGKQLERGLVGRLPETATEQFLSEAWKKLIGVETVFAGDDFFTLGGHSLTATLLISRIREHTGLQLPLQSIFDNAKLADLAVYIDGLAPATTMRDVSPIPSVNRNEPMPLSPAQERLHFLDRLKKQSAVYNTPLILKIQGDLNHDWLDQTLTHLVEKHESLRTCFPRHGEKTVAIVKPAPASVLEIRKGPLDITLAEFGIEAGKAFDLASGPLFNFIVWTGSSDTHYLLLNLHHIISDGWSMGLLLRELIQGYRDFSEGGALQAEPLKFQYGDFAAWQIEQLANRAFDTQLKYWEEELKGLPPVLDLPTDFPRPKQQTFQGRTLNFEIDPTLSEKVSALCEDLQLTPFMVLLTLFQIQLAAYAQTTDLAVGTPVAGRTRPEWEPIVGCFINTLVMRGRPDQHASFAENLRRARQVVLKGFDHQDVPFDKVVEAVQPERNLSNTPLFQVLFVMQNTPNIQSVLPGLQLSLHENEQGIANFDLTLAIFEHEGGLRGTFEYSTDIFTHETIARWSEHFQNLLTASLTKPDAPISSHDWLTQNEKTNLLERWQGISPREDDWLPLHHALQLDDAGRADSVAILDPETGVQITYGFLDKMSNGVAHRLQKLGVRPGDSVAVYAERRPLTTLAFMAILKAGGAYLPMDPSQPEARHRAVLETEKPVVLLTESTSQPADFGLPVYPVRQILTSQDNPPKVNVSLQMPAYILFTSGTTGQPKGVVLSHLAATTTALAFDTIFNLTQRDICLQMAQLTFDVNIGEWIRGLRSGSKVVICPASWKMDPALLTNGLVTHQITTTEWVPAAAGMVSAYLEEKQKVDAPLRHFALVGDATNMAGYRAMQRWLPDTTQIYNCYGVTEAAIHNTWQLQPPELNKAGNLPIGRPFGGNRAYILDKFLRPLPIGVRGMLYLAGEVLAQGYLNMPQETALKFCPNPFSNKPGDRMYLSGDWARYLANGSIDFLGRADFQIKLRGFRIETEEICTHLIKLEGVEQAVVILRDDLPAGGEHLVAYLETKSLPEQAEIRRHLRKHLPDYMIPSFFVAVERFTVNSNGKIDRKTLPIPDTSASRAGEFIAPEGKTEQQIADIWSRLLGVENIGRFDNFFDLGGHSLLAAKLLSQLRAEFEAPLDLKDLFESLNLADLAEKLVFRSMQDELLAGVIDQAPALPSEDQEVFNL